MPYDVPVPAVIKSTNGAGEEIRRFADSNLSASIDKALSQIPEGHKIAVVADANLKGAGGAVMYKIGSDWSFVTTVHKDFGGDLSAGAVVRWSR